MTTPHHELINVELTIEEVAVICFALGYYSKVSEEQRFPNDSLRVPMHKLVEIVRKLDDARLQT
jgi:hypothetical protein